MGPVAMLLPRSSILWMVSLSCLVSLAQALGLSFLFFPDMASSDLPGPAVPALGYRIPGVSRTCSADSGACPDEVGNQGRTLMLPMFGTCLGRQREDLIYNILRTPVS